VAAAATAAPVGDDELPPTSLRAAADTAEAGFDAAVARHDAPGATRAVLDLEQAIQDWSADTTQSDDHDHARRTLRSLVVRLGELAEGGVGDPAARVAPFVDLLLRQRDRARDARDWPAADAVRDGLAELGVQLRDTPDGTSWSLRGDLR
jgi:cysteinyl-tRNA synthetase